MKIPMMPKGVEHELQIQTNAGVLRVKIPMMPKGVEHPHRVIFALYKALVVKIPMMPKGVEHMNRRAQNMKLISCEDSNDAERR